MKVKMADDEVKKTGGQVDGKFDMRAQVSLLESELIYLFVKNKSKFNLQINVSDILVSKRSC